VLLLLGIVVCVASVPPVDDPDTAIDESEFQVILATPSPLGCKLLPPLANSVDLARPASHSQNVKAHIFLSDFILVAKQSRSHSIQKLLCTFLI
jgi:hypothetical protein